MAVALRELERSGRPRPRLRVVVPPPPRTPRWVFLVRRLLVLAVLIGVVAAVVATVGATWGPPASAATGPVAPLTVTVVIGPGETLWDVASRYVPDGRDRTAWVAEVAADNGVDAGALRPGTPVAVPIEGAGVTARPRPAGE
jgi:hypothetical protein